MIIAVTCLALVVSLAGASTDPRLVSYGVDESPAVLSEIQGPGLVIHQVISKTPCLSLGKRNEPELPAKGLINVANRRQKATSVRQPARTADRVGCRIDFTDGSIADRDCPKHRTKLFFDSTVEKAIVLPSGDHAVPQVNPSR